MENTTNTGNDSRIMRVFKALPRGLKALPRGLKALLDRWSILIAIFLFLLGIILIDWVLPLLEEETTIYHPPNYHLVRDIAIALIVAGTVGTLYDLMMRGEFREVTQESLRNTLAEHSEELKALAKIRRAGLVTIHESLPENIGQRFGEAKEKVQILESWTGYTAVGMQRWIREAVRRGCNVEILLLNPDSPCTGYRARALHADGLMLYTEVSVKQDIEDELTVLEGLRRELSQKDEYKGALQIKVYDAPAILEMYRFDDTRIIGMHLYGAESVGGPQFEVVGDARNGSPDPLLAEKVDAHFKTLWQNADHAFDVPAVREQIAKQRVPMTAIEMLKMWFGFKRSAWRRWRSETRENTTRG